MKELRLKQMVVHTIIQYLGQLRNKLIQLNFMKLLEKPNILLVVKLREPLLICMENLMENQMLK